MSQPLNRDSWRISARILRWLYPVHPEDPEQQDLFRKQRNDFVEFIQNLRALTADLPPAEPSDDEDSDVEAGSEGDSESSSDEDEGILRQTE